METKLFNIPSLDKISYENDILSIVLDFGTIKKEKIVANCIFFKIIEESYALKTIDSHDFDGIKYLFVFENSDLLNWFNNESYHIYESKILHHRILCLNHIVDLICLKV